MRETAFSTVCVCWVMRASERVPDRVANDDWSKSDTIARIKAFVALYQKCYTGIVHLKELRTSSRSRDYV